MTGTAPTPREAADRVALWLDQWRPDRHQTYSLARADLQVLIDQARATTPGDDRGRELAGIVRLAERVRDRQSSVDVRDQVDDLLAALRALAPAETEAGDGGADDGERVEWLAHHLRSNGGHVEVHRPPYPIAFRDLTETESRRIASACLAALAATPPAPEGEAVPWPPMKVNRRDGSYYVRRPDIGPPADIGPARPWVMFSADHERMHGRERADREVFGPVWVDVVVQPAPAAGPQAEGAGETAGGKR